jgi:hypothetical protein
MGDSGTIFGIRQGHVKRGCQPRTHPHIFYFGGGPTTPLTAMGQARSSTARRPSLCELMRCLRMAEGLNTMTRRGETYCPDRKARGTPARGPRRFRGGRSHPSLHSRRRLEPNRSDAQASMSVTPLDGTSAPVHGKLRDTRLSPYCHKKGDDHSLLMQKSRRFSLIGNPALYSN